MARRRPVAFTAAEVVARFEAGEGRLDLTRRYRVRVAEIDAALATAGYEPPTPRYARHGPERLQLPEADIVRRYVAGESELALSKAYGCTRAPIRRVLTEHGVSIRGRGAAMDQRHARLTPSEQAALAEPAQIARRSRPATEEEKELRAQTRGHADSGFVSPHEMDLDERLKRRGLVAHLQQPVGRYNIDLGFEPLAVEVHRYTGHPLKYDGQVTRVAYLAERGWSTLYVWLRLVDPMTDAVADVVADQVARYRADPVAFGTVRTIRARSGSATLD